MTSRDKFRAMVIPKINDHCQRPGRGKGSTRTEFLMPGSGSDCSCPRRLSADSAAADCESKSSEPRLSLRVAR